MVRNSWAHPRPESDSGAGPGFLHLVHIPRGPGWAAGTGFAFCAVTSVGPCFLVSLQARRPLLPGPDPCSPVPGQPAPPSLDTLWDLQGTSPSHAPFDARPWEPGAHPLLLPPSHTIRAAPSPTLVTPEWAPCSHLQPLQPRQTEQHLRTQV